LKISVLNRGATAGLIRNVGDLSSNGHSWQLSRCNAPKPAVDLSDLQMAVPVAVTNPSSDNERTSAVGKVEAHSMNELWFDVTAAANGDSVANLVSSYRADHLANATVVLHDHKAGTIEQKIQR
jgi:hypothetical protein